MRHYQGKGARLIYDVVRSPEVDYGTVDRHQIMSADGVAILVRKLQELGHWPAEREAFGVVLLDNKHRFIGLHIAHVGTLSTAPMHPREVFRAAIAAGCRSLVAVHNHPSGDTTPSAEDSAVTERLREAGELLGIELLDHVIVGDEHYSFAEKG